MNISTSLSPTVIFISLVGTFILAFVAGYAATLSAELARMTLRAIPVSYKEFKKYFYSPTDEKFEFDWFLYKLFLLLSKSIGERWYEARAHTHQSIWVSLLCAFGIATIVRYEFFSSKDDNRMFFKNKVWYWRLSFKTRQERMDFIEDYAKQVQPHVHKDADGLYQIFIAGENVVWDYMNGDLRKSWEERVNEV